MCVESCFHSRGINLYPESQQIPINISPYWTPLYCSSKLKMQIVSSKMWFVSHAQCVRLGELWAGDLKPMEDPRTWKEFLFSLNFYGAWAMIVNAKIGCYQLVTETSSLYTGLDSLHLVQSPRHLTPTLPPMSYHHRLLNLYILPKRFFSCSCNPSIWTGLNKLPYKICLVIKI